MALKDDLISDVRNVFSSVWTERDGNVVPADTSLQLGNDAVKLKATVFYADMADSTNLVDGYKPWFAAEIYKTFLSCAAKIIRSEGGVITAYDGDRVMAVFIGDTKNTSAVKAALKLKWAVDEIIQPIKNEKYKNNTFSLRHVVGIDTSHVFVAKTGVRGANDLVWVGRAANYAAKLSALPEGFTYITEAVFKQMSNNTKISSQGKPMWQPFRWDKFEEITVYRSNWRWPIR